MHCVCAIILGAIIFNLRFKIDVVVIIIWSIVIIINFVLTLQVSTASLPHDREPCEIKVVSNHTCSLHTCVCAGSRRVIVRLSGFRRQGISSTPGGLLKCPIPVRVCAEHISISMYSVGLRVKRSFPIHNTWPFSECCCGWKSLDPVQRGKIPGFPCLPRRGQVKMLSHEIMKGLKGLSWKDRCMPTRGQVNLYGLSYQKTKG